MNLWFFFVRKYIELLILLCCPKNCFLSICFCKLKSNFMSMWLSIPWGQKKKKRFTTAPFFFFLLCRLVPLSYGASMYKWPLLLTSFVAIIILFLEGTCSCCDYANQKDRFSIITFHLRVTFYEHSLLILA